MPKDRKESLSGGPRKQQCCARCGGGLLRIHRSAKDLRCKIGLRSRRYRCVEPGCGLEVLLPRGPHAPSRAEPGAARSSAGLWALALGSLLVFVMAAVALGLWIFMPEGVAGAASPLSRR